MNIVAYCRVSTDKEDQLNSLEVQKQFFEEYAQRNRYNLVKIYADEGISGTKIKNREEFKKLLKDAKSNIFEMVVVKDISRFARNTVDLLCSTRELKSLGIETTFLTSNMTVIGQSEFVLTIFAALAQEESANTSKRVKFGKKVNAQKGKVPNIVYGYDKIKGDYFNLTINKEEENVIKRIYNLYLTQGYGANKISQILNADGIRTKRNCKWSQNAISRILTNELYTGTIINGKEEVKDFLTSKREKKDENDWYVVHKEELRIIDDETFKNAQNLLRERNIAFNIKHERQSNKHLFSTLIRCTDCGYSFRRTQRVYKNTYTSWVCSGRNANGVDYCSNMSKIDEEELKNEIKTYFLNILNQKEQVIKTIVKEFDKVYNNSDDNKTTAKTINNKITKSHNNRKKYMEMYEDELITREELREKMSLINKDIENLERELKLVESNLSKSEQLENVIEDTFKNIDSILDMDKMTNAQLKKIIEKITVNEQGKVDVYLKLLSDIGLEQTVLISNNQT